ncbi:MAG: tetratricopeptide repeat protein [Sandaracinaceae bacterium]
MTDDPKSARWDAAQEGAELLTEGEPQLAIDELERVLEDDPDNEYAYFFLGNAHFELSQLDKAMKAYVLALERAPEYVGAMVALGHTLRLLGRHEQALRMGHQVLARDKDDTDALYLMGLSHYARGESAAAVRYLERFLQSGPEIETAQEVHGLLEILRGGVAPGGVLDGSSLPEGDE